MQYIDTLSDDEEDEFSFWHKEECVMAMDVTNENHYLMFMIPIIDIERQNIDSQNIEQEDLDKFDFSNSLYDFNGKMKTGSRFDRIIPIVTNEIYFKYDKETNRRILELDETEKKYDQDNEDEQEEDFNTKCDYWESPFGRKAIFVV